MTMIRILEIDGGGMKGLFSAYFMQMFCQQAGIKGDEIWKYFDIICGTSIGGISALGYAHGITPSTMVSFFRDKGPIIFDGPFGEGPAGSGTLGYVLITPLVDPYIYYAEPLRQALTDVLEDTKMYQLKTTTLITSLLFNGGTAGNLSGINFPYGTINYAIPQNISNAVTPFTLGQNYSCVEVGLATSAAPVYFPPTKITQDTVPGNFYIDGGIYQNNPTNLSYTLAQTMFPGMSKCCILSVGTGLTNIGFDLEPFTPPVTSGYFDIDTKVGLSPQNSLSLLSNVLSMAITCPQEAVSLQLGVNSLYSGARNNIYYYRFQTKFNPAEPTQLDNVSTQFMNYMQKAAQQQYGFDQQRISAFITNAQF